MNAEPDAHLQHFTSAVYGQNDTVGENDTRSDLAWIESRSMGFSNFKQNVEMGGTVPAIPEGLLRHWVDADIASFRRLEGLEDQMDIEIAADNIAANHQMYADYQKEMQQLAGDVSKRVDELSEASRKRGVEQDRVTARDLVARLRDTDSQRRLPPNENEVDGFAGGTAGQEVRPADPELVTRILEGISYKGQTDGSVLYLLNNRAAFIDHGRQIVIDKAALLDDDSILAAVLLAKEKYNGAFSLTGSDDFKRRAMEVIAKHNVAVKLKSPAQELLLAEVGLRHASFTNRPQGNAALTVKAETASPVADAELPVEPDAPGELPAADSCESGPLEIKPVVALDWWSTQHKVIDALAASAAEKNVLRHHLGDAPLPDKKYWFDLGGNYVADPDIESLRAYEMKLAAAREHYEITEDQPLNDKGSNTVMTENENNSPVLRGVRWDEVKEDWETTMLLFKGKGDYLQGFVVLEGEKQQVLAHINQRKADESGEVKPNFLKVSKRDGQGDDATWTELGFGNALNSRSDSKPVYFDEVLFNINGKTMAARLGKDVQPDLHSHLGFASGRLERPKAEPKDASEGPKNLAPEQKAELAAPVVPSSDKAPPKRRSAGAK